MDKQHHRTQRVRTANELFAEMSLRHVEPLRAHRAFNRFCKEYRDQLLGTCVLLCKRFNVLCATENAKDICQEVLLKAYLHADKFDSNKGSAITWMATIAKNELLTMLKNQVTFISLEDVTQTNKLQQKQKAEQSGNIDTNDDTDEEGAYVFVKEETATNPKLERIEKFLHSLPEREEDIIRTTLLFSPGNVPTKELDRIEEKYGVTRDNIKQIRKRIMDKLKGLDNEDTSVVV